MYSLVYLTTLCAGPLPFACLRSALSISFPIPVSLCSSLITHTRARTPNSLVFRWYLSKSSGWANRGDAKRKLDFQIWCGPAIGSYNTFAAGTFLDPRANGSGLFPSVVDVNEQLLNGACFLARARKVASHPLAREGDARRLVEEASKAYVPSEEMRFEKRG